MSIPKKIFYCWFGGKKPESINYYTDNWKNNLPTYEIIEINEYDKEFFDFESELNNNLWFRTCYERKLWAYCSDYARMKVLYNNGGIYLDTDVTICKDFDELLKKNKLILGWENERGVNAAVIITNSRNTVIKNILDFYSKEIWESKLYTIPSIILEILKREYKLNRYTKITENQDILIMPPEYFYPMPYGEKDAKKYITNNSYTIHWWNASWQRAEHVLFLEHKHIFKLEEIDEKIKSKMLTISKNNFIQNVFSIKKTLGGKHKVVTLFWMKYMYKIKESK